MCYITQNKLYLFCVFTFHTMTFPYTVILIHNGHQWCVNKHILTVIFIFSEYAGTMEAGVLDSSSRVHPHELGVRCVGVRRRAMVEHHHARPQEATRGGGRNQPLRQCRGQVVKHSTKIFGSNREK